MAYEDLTPEKLNELLREGRRLREKLEPVVREMQTLPPSAWTEKMKKA